MGASSDSPAAAPPVVMGPPPTSAMETEVTAVMLTEVTAARAGEGPDETPTLGVPADEADQGAFALPPVSHTHN